MALGAALSCLLACSTVAQRPAPERVHVIGASVSGGFEDGPLFGAETQGESVPLQKVVKAWGDGELRVTSHPPMEMWNLFRDPSGIGKKEIELAKRREPDLVVAIDFLFWFAYGYTSGDEKAARRANFEVGLGLLDQLQVPIVVGDLPDMKGAATRMIRPAQIPDAEMLKELNERLRAWVAERERVTLVPLAGIVKQLKDDGVELPLAGGPLKTPPKALLQEDGLHANRLGMALLGLRLQQALQQQFPEGHELRTQQWTFEQFVEAARAEFDLEALQARGKETAKSGG